MAENKYMVVGLDGSPGSLRALEWAAQRTGVFGPIQPVAAWHYPWWAITPPVLGALLPPPGEEMHDATRRLVDETIASSVREIDRLEVLTVHGSAGPALVDAAASASLLVVGSRGRGVVASAVLGSVSLHCVHHATVPVAVIPPEAPTAAQLDRVVVGVDGSKRSIAALRWALENTDTTTSIEALYAWNPVGIAIPEVEALAREQLAAQAANLATETVTAARNEAGQPDREVTTTVRQGDPRIELRARAIDADLLVVGAHGTGGLTRTRLGSVANDIVHQPVISTIVVR